MVSLEYDAVPGGDNALFDIANCSSVLRVCILSAHVQFKREVVHDIMVDCTVPGAPLLVSLLFLLLWLSPKFERF
jgi:hypothetical protein